MDKVEKKTWASDTAGYYELHAEEFAKDTADADVSALLVEFASLLPQGATVLDWGCGTGRDSRALQDMGFAVDSTDASLAMCQVAKRRFGIDPTCESFDDLNAKSAYDGIWACASLLHIERTSLPSAFRKAKTALKPGGVLYASFKYGAFEGVRNGRWYTDLDEGTFEELVVDDFDIVRIWLTGDVRPGRSDEKWLNCLLRKRL